MRQELARRAAAVAAAKTGPVPRSREASKPFDFVLRVAGPDNAETQVVEEIPAALTSPKSRMEVEVGLVSSPSFPSPEPPTTGQPKPPLQMSPPPTQPSPQSSPEEKGLPELSRPLTPEHSQKDLGHGTMGPPTMRPGKGSREPSAEGSLELPTKAGECK